MKDTAALQQSLELREPRVAGLAACIALLELEARALGHPLAAMLLAAAGEELRDRMIELGISPAEASGSTTARPSFSEE